MNDLETLLQLVMLLAKYGNSVIVHDVFRDELAGLLAKSGSEDKFFKRLASYIQQLVENGEAAIGSGCTDRTFGRAKEPLCYEVQTWNFKSSGFLCL